MRLSKIGMNGLEVLVDSDFATIGLLGEDKNDELVAVERMDELSDPSWKNVSAVVCRPTIKSGIPKGIGIIQSENPKLTLLSIHQHLFENTDFYGMPAETIIHKSAVIHPSAIIAEKSVTIGEGCRVGPRAVILEGTNLGPGVAIGPGTLVGSDSLAMLSAGPQVEIHCAGGVNLKREVGIHSNCVIRKPVFKGFTEIDEFAKIDNLVEIGAGVRIGQRSFVIASSIIGDRARIGKDVWIGPNSTIDAGINVGDNAFVTMGSVVIEDVLPGQKVSGNFAIPHDKLIKLIKQIR